MKHVIPEAALAQHVIALGKTGSGKSAKLRVLVEGLLDRKKPVCIIDPKGDWWGLKSAADGKHPGYAVVIFGGKRADVPLNARAGAQVAELIGTGNRPCLIDLKGWSPGDRTRFFIDFAESLFNSNKGARHLVIDEAHHFAPKGKILSVEAGQMLHWANRLASEGRGLGITLIAASQRPQKVHNDFLTSCETLIACRVIHKADRDAVKDWIDGCADPELGQQVIRELAGMKRPEAWVWSPEIDFGPKRITWPLFTTYDSFKPQDANTAKLKGWADVDLEDVRAKLAKVVQEAEAKDPVILQKRIAELERQVRAKGAPIGPTREDLQSAEQRGYERGRAAGATEAQRAVAAHVKELRAAAHKALEAAFGGIPMPLPLERHRNATTAGASVPIQLNSRARPAQPPRSAAPARLQPPSVPAKVGSNGVGASLAPGQAKVLAALIQYPDGLTREQLTVLAGYKRSTRDLYLQQLQRAELVGNGAGGRLVATTAGIAALPDAEPLPTGKALQDHWLARLPVGERKVLEVLIAAYPDAVDRDTISERAGYLRSTRDLYIQQLQRRQLVESSREGVKASEDLF